VTTENNKNTRTRNLLIAAAIMIVAAFLLGFVPQFRNASQLRDELRASGQRIEQLQREAGLSKARDLAGLLYLQLTRKNYGIAAQHATAFFDHIRALMNGTLSPESRSALENIANHRDAIVASIAKSDPAVEAQAGDILERTHRLTAP
jgi:hypothetical protein